MPLPIWALPDRPHFRPMETFLASYAAIQALDLMSDLRTTGPACMDVWISSPVRSKKPVLMKTIRSFTAWMQAARLAEVRRSSSITPTLIAWRGRASRSSTASNSRSVKAASSGPCILGLTI